MNETRPYLNAALLCENVIQENNGTLSLIRVVDRIEYDPQPAPQGYKPIVLIKGLVAIRSGALKGNFGLQIKVTGPNGKPKGEPLLLPSIELLGGDHGANVILNMQFVVEDDGLHWFDIYFENEILTRMPLTVVRKQEPLVTK